MLRIHRKNKYSEGGKDGGHTIVRRGKGEEERKPNTTTANFLKYL
jgi:hypothetical protein